MIALRRIELREVFWVNFTLAGVLLDSSSSPNESSIFNRKLLLDTRDRLIKPSEKFHGFTRIPELLRCNTK